MIRVFFIYYNYYPPEVYDFRENQWLEDDPFRLGWLLFVSICRGELVVSGFAIPFAGFQTSPWGTSTAEYL